jgi:arylsulfatase A-like enzyme
LLAELLRAHGYRTTAFVNAPFVGREYGFDRGFNRFDQRFEQRRRDVAERQEEILAAVAALEPPFFLFLHYMDVHTPYRPPAEFNLFAKDRRSSEVLRDLGVKSVLDLQRASRKGPLPMSPADRDRLIDLYDGEIRALDAHLGELLRRLEERFPDTVVVLTSDHGEEFLEHGGFGHGDTLYEEVLHVPLIVAGAGVPSGARVPAVVSLVDVTPTLLERVGAPVPAGLDGRSLLAELGAGGAAAGSTAAVDGAGTGDDARVLALHTASHDGTLSLRGVRDGDRKLLRDDRKGTVALYDLASDPREQRSGTPSASDARLEQALAQRGVVATGSAAPALDAKTVESLKALGYL